MTNAGELEESLSLASESFSSALGFSTASNVSTGTYIYIYRYMLINRFLYIYIYVYKHIFIYICIYKDRGGYAVHRDVRERSGSINAQ
jgi:hypothetical protein